MKVSVVILVYNEREFIEEILLRVQDVPVEKEIIVVDDFSVDGTREMLQEFERAQSDGRREIPVRNGAAFLRLAINVSDFTAGRTL